VLPVTKLVINIHLSYVNTVVTGFVVVETARSPATIKLGN